MRFDTSQGIEVQSRLRALTAANKSHENQTSFVSVSVWEFPEGNNIFYNMVLIKWHVRFVSWFEEKYFQFSTRVYVEN